MVEIPNLAQKICQNAQDNPDKIAITICSNRHTDLDISQMSLLEHASQYARALDEAGIKPGSVVILILQHSLALISAFWGTILHGAVPSIMPFLTEKLLPDHYRNGLEELFRITNPAAVITYSDFLTEVQAAARSSSSIMAILNCEQIQAQQPLDKPVLQGLTRLPGDLVLLQHSSGTTGLQKGVALTHQAVFNQIACYSESLDLSHDDVVISWLPLYHDMGLIAGFVLPFLTQVRLVLMSPFDWVRAPYKLMQAVSRYRGTLCWLPNFAYNFCAHKIRSRDLQGVDLSSLRAVINCSEPIHWKSHQLFLDRFQEYGLSADALATCYAMAENVFAVTQSVIKAPVPVDQIDQDTFLVRQVASPVSPSSSAESNGVLQLVSSGRPIRNTRIRIVDASGADLPERHVGEIVIQSNYLLDSYYHRPDLTQESFRDEWYLSGDLGYISDGELYVTGRKKDLIIVGGKNIYPQDIERLASEIPGIHPGRIAAFGIHNQETGTEEVILILELDNFDEKPDAEKEQLSQQIRQTVTQGSDIALRQVYLVSRNWLVKTSSGKIARTANREKYLRELS